MRRVAVLTLMLAAALSASAVAAERWVGAWGFPPISFLAADAPNPLSPVADFDNVTVRQLVRTAAGGVRLRVRFSNEFGQSELRFDHAHVALAAAGGATQPGTDHVLTFAGHAAGVIAPGAPLLSDPVEWPLPALARLAISVHVPATTIPPAHRVSAYVAPCECSADVNMADAQLLRTGALVSGVEVAGSEVRRVIVTLGDSITEGHGSTINEFRGWPDRLAERLRAAAATHRFSLVNAGINSNRLVHNNPGMGALARFDRDVLGVPGVGLILLLEGINDIGYSHTVPAQAVSADEMIGAYQQLIARAHAHGVALVAGTLTPFEDAHYYTPEGEALRQAVNGWIRTSNAFDGVIDFDAVLRDPARPARANPALTLTDHLHPNDAGYDAMANAIDLRLLARAMRRYPERN